MIVEAIAGTILGSLGLLPFIHTNLLIELFKETYSSGVSAAVFASALAASHLVFEVIPAIFFYIPSNQLNVSMLPSQRMVLEGKGILAMRITLNSFAKSTVLSNAFLPFFLLLIPFLFKSLKELLVWAMIGIISLPFISEKNPRNALLGIGVFLFSGMLGIYSFALSSQEALFPLLTGLFGTSSILLALREKQKIPIQEDIQAKTNSKTIAVGTILGAFSVLFPALTPAFLCSAAFFAMEEKREEYLSLNASIVSSKAFFDFAGVHAIGKARSGAAAHALEALPFNTAFDLIPILASFFFSLFASTIAVIFLYKKIIKRVYSIDFFKMNLLFFATITLAVLLFSGLKGMLIASASTAVGLLPCLLKIKRSYCLGALMLPSIIYSLGFG